MMTNKDLTTSIFGNNYKYLLDIGFHSRIIMSVEVLLKCLFRK